MKFHPVISIILGVIATFIFLILAQAILIYPILNALSSLYLIILIFGILIGGYVATYFAKEIKIRYSLYEGFAFGMLIQIISYLLSNQLPGTLDIVMGMFLVVIFILISGIGGYIAKSWGKPIQKTLSLLKGDNG